MPLPKSVTIAAKATEVYCEVWSVILQQVCRMPPIRNSDLKELSQLLPYLRQLLTCCACAGLLDNAMISLTCGHCYCFECQFREPLLKIQCRQCRERNGLVIENQLQLVVKCYKHMCYILGEELRRNPSVLDTTEPQVSASPEKLGVGGSETDPPVADREQDVVPSPKESAVFPMKKGVVVDPSFDAIAEIVREVEKGMKVSRAILIIKPPSKYLSIKPSVATKKESAVATKKESAIAKSVHATRTPAHKNPSAGENEKQVPEKATPGGDGNVKVKRGRRNLSLKLAKATKIPNDKSLRLAKAAKVSNGRTHKRTVACKKEELQEVSSDPKKGVTTLPYRANRHSQPHDRKKKRVAVGSKKTKSVADSATETTTSEEEKVIDIGGKSQPSPALPNSPPVMSEPLQTCPVHSFEVRVDSLPVSVHCLDSSYLSITSEVITRLPQEEPGKLLADALSSAPNKGAAKKKTSFVEGQWRKATRKRKWGALCPSVVVKRPREAIAKMVLMQSKAAKGKRRARHKTQQQQQQRFLLHSTNQVVPPCRPASLRPPGAPPFSRVPLPCPPLPHFNPADDLPLPDDIPILPSDGDQELQDASDLKWKELSDLLENSNDEASRPPFGHFGLPLPPPPHHHPPGLDPVTFGEYAPRHFRPPYLHPPPPHPRHMLPPLPHPGPHTPVIPFPPTLRPDMPPHDGGYFSPVLGPEDFLSSGGIGPDGGGYSGPMTPRRNYSTSSMCPDGPYQHSPGHHPGGPHFPIPSPGVKFPPPGRHFPPGPPLTPPKPKNGPMSKMVGKMKIKSPGQQRKKHLSPGNQGNQVKKRRSPGYSEVGWRCRCGTNNVMFPKKVCAKGKCPCYTKGIACKNCLCRNCHNPFGGRELSTSSTSPVENDPDQDPDLDPDTTTSEPELEPEPDPASEPDPDPASEPDLDPVVSE